MSSDCEYVIYGASVEANNYFTKDFTNNSLTINFDFNNCDTMRPEYLEFELPPNTNMSMSDFKTICDKISLKMYIFRDLILDIPLRFMKHMKPYEECDNKLYISIPFQMFSDDIKLIALQYCDLKFVLTNTENTVMSCKLISKGVHLKQFDRSKMALSSRQTNVLFLASTEINSIEKRTNFTYEMKFDSLQKGIFIEVENVDEINEINFLIKPKETAPESVRDFDYTVREMSYNRFLVKNKGIKINQHLLYFPWNLDLSYTGWTCRDLDGALDMSKKNVTLNLTLDNPQSKICIYGLGLNVLSYISGYAGLFYSYKFTGHNCEECNI